MAIQTVRGNKLRSALTILGVVIGITSIVGMTSLIRGFDESLRDQVRTLGPGTIFVTKLSIVSISSGVEFSELLRRPNLTVDDAKAIEKLAPSIDIVDVMILFCALVSGIISSCQESTMNFWVQGLYPAIHDFRKARYCGNISGCNTGGM